METLYNELMRRGASEVIAVYTPPVDGDGQAGIDDYLASGGDLMNLYTQSGPYTRLDVSHKSLPGIQCSRRVSRGWRGTS